MSKKVTIQGKVERKGLAMGVWALVGDDGKTYELHNPPPELRKAIAGVKITGNVRSDLMSIAMIGPILEVESFQLNE